MTAQDRANVRRNPVCASRIPCALHSLHLWATLYRATMKRRTNTRECYKMAYCNTQFYIWGNRINNIRMSILLRCG